MAKTTNKTLILNSEELGLLGEEKEYELIPNQKGIFLLIDKTLIKGKEGTQVCVKVPALEEEKQEVIGLIKKANLGDLVEGKFEASLNEKQQKALLELVLSGKVFVFKLNETYKKGVYRVKEDEFLGNAREKKESENEEAKEKEWNAYTLETDGFLIIKGKDGAAKASFHYEKQIKEGLLRGIKSFDGNYYLIQTDLLEDYIRKTILAFKNKNNLTLEELSKANKTSLMLTRIIVEFLKEEGELLEKKKGLLHYIN